MSDDKRDEKLERLLDNMNIRRTETEGAGGKRIIMVEKTGPWAEREEGRDE